MATSRSKRFVSKEVNKHVCGFKEQNCVPCQKKRKDVVAVNYCYDCKQYQCEECSQCHELFGAMAGHKLEHVQTAKPGKSQADMRGLDMCSSHDKLYEYICLEHNELCCATCADVLHRGCKVVEIKTAVFRSDISLADVTKDIKETETSANNLLKNLKAQATDDKLHKEYQHTMNTIDASKRKIVSRFDELKAEVRSKYQEAEKANSQQIKTNITESETVLADIQKSGKVLNHVVEHGSDHQKYIAAKVMKHKAASSKFLIGHIQVKSHKLELPFQFHKEVKDVLKDDLALANYHINTIPLYPDITVHDMVVDLKLAASVEVKRESDDFALPFYQALAFLPDGRLVVADNGNHRIYLMDDRLRKLGTCKLDYSPRGIAVVSDTDVAVACYDALLFMRVTKANSINIIKKVDTKFSYSDISVMNDGKFLLGAYTNNENFMSVITAAGDELMFNNLPARIYGVCASFCTYARNRNRIVHVDKFANTLTMYKDDEGMLEKQVVVSDTRIEKPRGVCCMPDDSLLVCSKGTKSLVHISPEGCIISSYKLELTFPCTVCVSQDGKKVVVSDCQSGNHKLQLFNVTRV